MTTTMNEITGFDGSIRGMRFKRYKINRIISLILGFGMGSLMYMGGRIGNEIAMNTSNTPVDKLGTFDPMLIVFGTFGLIVGTTATYFLLNTHLDT